MDKMCLKKQIIILFLILFPNLFLAQNALEGRWMAKNLIGSTNTTTFSLVKEKEPNYGYSVSFNLDGTFSSGEAILCINGCSVSTSGTYTLIGNKHVRIMVNDVHLVGLTCGMSKTNNKKLIRDLGVFYIYKDGQDAIELIPSNGNLQEDEDKILYNQLTYNFYNEWKKYYYVWQSTNGSNQQEIINDCVDSRNNINLSNCKIVFSTKRDLEEFLILKDGKEFHYVVYDSYRKKVSLAYPKG